MSAMIEVRTCQLCGSSERLVMFQEPPYHVVRCAECSLVYVTPRHTDEHLPNIYGEDYWQSERPRLRGYASYREEEALYLKTFRLRQQLLQRYTGPGPLKVLDVGCAAGFFLRVMKEHGHQVRGVELSPEIAHLAIEHLGKENIHVGQMTDLAADQQGFEAGSFDLVTAWDVVEHVPDPQDLLRRVHRMLKPTGVLVIETQNVDSRLAGLLGRRWQHYKHEEHLYHFNPTTMRRLMDQAGFIVVHNAPAYGGKYVSLPFIAERANRLPAPVRVLFQPLRLFKNANLYLNLKDEMVVVARPISDRHATNDGNTKSGHAS
ncbi:MAG: class I SAM-dependent methyltransferase [Planctomycetota bacterium]|jgi:SAM-dependent methyltransferase